MATGTGNKGLAAGTHLSTDKRKAARPIRKTTRPLSLRYSDVSERRDGVRGRAGLSSVMLGTVMLGLTRHLIKPRIAGLTRNLIRTYN